MNVAGSAQSDFRRYIKKLFEENYYYFNMYIKKTYNQYMGVI